MIDWSIAERLMRAFPKSFIIYNGEFIAHRIANAYFDLKSCQNENDVKCKVLEFLSREAYKSTPYQSDKSNANYHKFMLNGINEFLGTRFIESDMDYIYTYFGNAIRHDKTLEFIEANYNMGFFRQWEVV